MPRRSRNRGAARGLLLWGLASLCVACLVACSGASSGSDHESALANQARFHGQQVYQNSCAACHDATDLHLIKDPPRLNGLFQKQTFPSGAPATDEELRNVILHGKGIMPPFEQAMSVDDLNALIQYMHTR